MYMEITNVNYALGVYLALIEGLSLFVLEFNRNYPIDLISGLIVGFIPMFLVLCLYRLISEELPLKINGKEITWLPILLPSLFNAVFIEIAFLIQGWLPNPTYIVSVLSTVISIIIAALILIVIYNKSDFKLEFELNNKLFKAKQVSFTFAVYAGLIELFIIPFIFFFYSIALHPLINGLVAGFIGSMIGLFIINLIIERKPLEITT